MNKEKSLALQLIEECIRTKNPVLDLGNCGLTDRSSELDMLKECRHVEVLNLGYSYTNFKNGFHQKSNNNFKVNVFNKIPSILNELPNIKSLSITKNRISKIENLGNLINLIFLDLSTNKISKIENLENLENLTELILSYNRISKIENLEKLYRLESMELSNNQFSSILSNDFSNGLKRLDLSGNQINYIEKIYTLNGLKVLKLEKTDIDTILPYTNLNSKCKIFLLENEIEEIESFTKDYYYPFELKDIAKDFYRINNDAEFQIFQCKETKNPILDLGNCGLSDDSPELAMLENFRHIKVLNLGTMYLRDNYNYVMSINTGRRNELSIIPQVINTLSSLECLSFHGNKIKEIASLINLTNISILDFGNNNIKKNKKCKLLNKSKNFNFT